MHTAVAVRGLEYYGINSTCSQNEIVAKSNRHTVHF